MTILRTLLHPRLRRRATLPALTLILTAGAAHAFGIQNSSATYANKQYRYELDVTLDAPIDAVEAVLRDYERYPQLDTRILQARVLERPNADTVVLETTLRACFGPFCRSVKRIERVQEGRYALTAITDASRSDVKFGETYTQLSTSKGGGTQVRYRTRITPGFWVPAFAGRRWMLSTLADATSDLFRNVEKKARENAGEKSREKPKVKLPPHIGAEGASKVSELPPPAS
jgi:hypothetical protein